MGVLPRVGGYAVGVQVGDDPDVDVRGRTQAFELRCDRDPRRLVAVGTADDEHVRTRVPVADPRGDDGPPVDAVSDGKSSRWVPAAPGRDQSEQQAERSRS